MVCNSGIGGGGFSSSLSKLERRDRGREPTAEGGIDAGLWIGAGSGSDALFRVAVGKPSQRLEFRSSGCTEREERVLTRYRSERSIESLDIKDACPFRDDGYGMLRMRSFNLVHPNVPCHPPSPKDPQEPDPCQQTLSFIRICPARRIRGRLVGSTSSGMSRMVGRDGDESEEAKITKVVLRRSEGDRDPVSEPERDEVRVVLRAEFGSGGRG